MANINHRASSSFMLFVGGLHRRTTEIDIEDYLSQFGKILETDLKIDHITKKSRGFALIGFESLESLDKVLKQEAHLIRGKKVDCKRAMPKEQVYYLNKNIAERCRKVFIHNIDKDIDKEALKSFFGQYGEITDFNLIYKNKNYGFLYIIFELDEIAISLIEQKFVQFQQHKLEIKKAVPKKEHKKIQYKPQKIEFPILSELYKSPGSYDSYYSTACTPLESRDYRTSTHKDRASFHYDPYISSARHHDTDHCGYPIPVKCQKVDHLQVVCKGRYGRCNTHQGEMSASKGHNDIDFHNNNYRQRIRSEHLAGDSNYRYSNNQLRQTDLSEFYAQEVAPCSKTVANSLYFNGIKEFSLFRRCNSNILQEFQNRHMLTGIIDKKIVLETDNLRNEPTHGFIENI